MSAQGWAAAEVLALADALGSPRTALSVLTLRLLQPALLSWPELRAAAEQHRARTSGALPPHPLPARLSRAGSLAVKSLWAAATPDALALSGAAEALLAGHLGEKGRRAAGLYFTPPELAALIVELALRHGAVPQGELLVQDPCAGAGAFLAAAARALGGRAQLHGCDLQEPALQAARAQLALLGHQAVWLRKADALFAELPQADLLVSNPPYGKVDGAAARARIGERWPALRGGEIDRYAAFLLRSLDLVRPGGTVALLVPDSWMTNSRGGGIRAAVLEQAELAAVADLGKPFAAAKDTRVQAVVLVRRATPLDRARPRPVRVCRASGAAVQELAPLDQGALAASAKAGWQPYRTPGEHALCEAMLASSVALGSACTVGYGLRTGDNGRHVVRGAAPAGGVALLGGEDIVPFALRLRPKFLPAASAQGFASLVQRQLGRPRIAIQRIRTNSGQSHARWLEAAPCPPDFVCLDSISTLACDDDDLRWALLGLVSSTAVNRYHRLRTTDVNVKPALLRTLPLPKALLDEGGARQLAGLSRARAQEAAQDDPPRDGPAPELERAIDHAVYQLYRLSNREVDVCEAAHWADRFRAERPRLLALRGALRGAGPS